MTWNGAEKLFAALSQYLYARWQCGLPDGTELPSADVEAACDAWALRLVAEPDGHHSPPREVQRWLLARLVCAHALAENLASAGEPPPAGAPSEMLAQCLIGEWHGYWRAQWRDLRLYEKSFPA
jgi:hypothetical protein